MLSVTVTLAAVRSPGISSRSAALPQERRNRAVEGAQPHFLRVVADHRP